MGRHHLALLAAASALVLPVAPAQAADDDVAGCAGLSESRLEQIGDREMGRMLGDEELHEEIDALMERRHGEEGARAMHRALGARVAGCDLAGTPFGAGMPMGPGGGPGMWGGDVGALAALASEDDEDDAAAAIAAAAFLVLFPLLALAALLLLRRRGPRPAGTDPARDLLERRLASGDIDPADFDVRLKALKGDA